jgi:hypothetical protein
VKGSQGDVPEESQEIARSARKAFLLAGGHKLPEAEMASDEDHADEISSLDLSSSPFYARNILTQPGIELQMRLFCCLGCI